MKFIDIFLTCSWAERQPEFSDSQHYVTEMGNGTVYISILFTVWNNFFSKNKVVEQYAVKNRPSASASV